MRRHSTHARDAAMAQLSRVNRWLVAGSVVLTGVFAEIAANAFPGHSKRSAAHGAAGSQSRSQGTTTNPAPLQSPEQTPGSAERAPGSESPAGEAQSSPPTEAPSGQGEAGAAPSEPQPAPETPRASETPPAESTPREPAPEASGPVVSGGS
jgi:hypothetical protein